jgi:Ca2+:H+ antiporter
MKSNPFKPSLDWLLVLVPVSIAIRYVPALNNDVALFICAGLAIVPLAGLMGKATEHLAAHVGQGVGGLLNATFGNAAELIIALMALHKGLVGVVKASITGSIIGNMLLVFGLSAAVGGSRFAHQKFNRTAASSSVASLALAAVALLIPTVFHVSSDARPEGWSPVIEQRLSLAIALILFVTYLCTLVFSLKTHCDLFVGDADDQHAGPVWSKAKSLTVLLVATIFVAWLSEFLVGSVEAAREKFGLTEVFVGVIVVAIIGNAAEHSTAVAMAWKNKMDLSLGIAIGSSQQIAMFVAPVLVFASYLFGAPMNLEFTLPEVVAVFASVYLVAQISSDGESNWLEGAQLLALYAVLGVLFYFLPAHH